MKSMTGFAKRQCNIGDRKYTIEIKALNSKQMDANVKLPVSLREYELDFRAMLNRLERGKIDFSISEEQGSVSASRLNGELAAQRYAEVRQLAESVGSAADEQMLLGIVLQQSDIWSGTEETDLTEEQWNQLAAEVGEAIAELDGTRLHEGTILKADFKKHVDLIEHYLGEIPQYEGERITVAKERMRSMLADAAVKDVDSNRFEQELIYYPIHKMWQVLLIMMLL